MAEAVGIDNGNIREYPQTWRVKPKLGWMVPVSILIAQTLCLNRRTSGRENKHLMENTQNKKINHKQERRDKWYPFIHNESCIICC